MYMYTAESIYDWGLSALRFAAWQQKEDEKVIEKFGKKT